MKGGVSMEKWKPIKGFEGLYEVSNKGRIKSMKRYVPNRSGKMLVEEKILSLAHDNKGYYRVSLCREGKQFPKKVHRIVAEAFVDNPNNKPQVNHINGIKDDNRAENLEWVTNAENQIHANRSGLRRSPKGETHYAYGTDHPNNKAVIQYDDEGNFIAEYHSLAEAARSVGASDYSCISHCCRGVIQHSFGYRWKYKKQGSETIESVGKRVEYSQAVGNGEQLVQS